MGHPSWGPMWPKCQTSKMKTLVRSDGIRLTVREELVPLVKYLCDETERLGYNLVNGWCWGFACRPIRGSKKTPSNHSGGLAVDLNAPNNPMGPVLITDIPRKVVQLWEAHGFRWGGSYKSRPDAMHMEFMLSLQSCLDITARLHEGTAPVNLMQYLPIRLHKGTKADPFVKNEAVGVYQKNINKWIDKFHPVQAPTHLKEDDVYGGITAMYTVAFKTWMRKFQQDFGKPMWPDTHPTVGPVTFGALQELVS